jgi:hypothetical protein
MPLVGLEPTIPVFERAKTFHALDRAVTVVGVSQLKINIYEVQNNPTQGVEIIFLITALTLLCAPLKYVWLTLQMHLATCVFLLAPAVQASDS